MRNVASVSSDESSILIMNPQFWFFAHLNDHRRSLFCNAINISWWVNFFLSLFIAFRTKVRISIIPSLCSLFFALHLERSLNLSTDKNQIQFVYLRTCVPLYLVCGSNFLQVVSTFCRNTQKRAKAN